MSATATLSPLKDLDAATVALVKTWKNDGKDTLDRMSVVYRANLGGVSLSDLATVTTRALVRAAHPDATAEQIDSLATLPTFRVSKSTLGQLLNAYTLLVMARVEATPATAKAARTVFGQGGKAYSTMQTELRHILETAADAGTPFTTEQFVELAGQAMADARHAHRNPVKEAASDGGEVEASGAQVAQSTRQADTVADVVTTPPSVEGVRHALSALLDTDWTPEQAAQIALALRNTAEAVLDAAGVLIAA